MPLWSLSLPGVSQRDRSSGCSTLATLFRPNALLYIASRGLAPRETCLRVCGFAGGMCPTCPFLRFASWGGRRSCVRGVVPASPPSGAAGRTACSDTPHRRMSPPELGPGEGGGVGAGVLPILGPWRRMAQQSCDDTDCADGPWLRLHLYVPWVDHGCEPHHQCRFGLDGRLAGQHGTLLVSGTRLRSHDLLPHDIYKSDTWLPPG